MSINHRIVGVVCLSLLAQLVWIPACEAGETSVRAADPLEEVARGLDQPVDFASDPGHESRFYIVEQGGRIRVIENGELLEEPFFEIDRSNFTDRGWEQGLLGIALDPGWQENRRFYVNYTGSGGTTHISRFTAESPHRASTDTEQVLFTVDQPFANHNCGCLRFGPDGMLYIGLGDGGAAHDPYDNAQDLSTPLGTLLRIDVTGETPEGRGYTIPEDNPFRSRRGADAKIWAYGLRNPWKFEFDSEGRLWIADVGQNAYEEVHVQPADSIGGENYGWDYMEGAEPFRRPGANKNEHAAIPSGLEDPVFTYEHHPVASITGGYLYEGEKVEALKNRYICADFMSGRVWTFELGEDGKAADVEEVTDKYRPAFGGEGARQAISSFGRDNEGELYILDHRAGRLLKIVE